jgi:hypothetical protein
VDRFSWYTGHGSPGSFTFDNASHDYGDIVPADARWGDRDLEWMQLESCNVLQFDSGGTPIWDRWAKVFDGRQTVVQRIAWGTGHTLTLLLFGGPCSEEVI